MTDVVSSSTPQAEPPTAWVEQLDAAIERENSALGGPHPADLVASWLSWYAHQLALVVDELDAERRRNQHDLNRAVNIARQLTGIIVNDLTIMARFDAELREASQ